MQEINCFVSLENNATIVFIFEKVKSPIVDFLFDTVRDF